ncbi:site-specific DNA-methyltransferase, partial [Escherichia coli]
SVKAAMSLGRRAIGVELETERFEQTVKEISHILTCSIDDGKDG